MKTKIYILVLFTFSIGVFLNGCSKKDNDAVNSNPSSADTSSKTAIQDIYAESFYDDLVTMENEFATGSLNLFREGQHPAPLCGCATLTYDTLNHSDNDSIVINFGVFFCLNSDGRSRRGAVIICYPGGKQLRDSGNVISILLDHYFVDNHSVNGSVTVTNMGHIGRNLTWNIAVNGLINFANNGGTLTWTSNRVRTLLTGEITYDGNMDWGIAKVSITGTASGTCADGSHFTSRIDSPLVRDFSCIGYYRFISQGKISFMPANKPPRYLDFGDGSCEDSAQITIGGVSKVFTMI